MKTIKSILINSIFYIPIYILKMVVSILKMHIKNRKMYMSKVVNIRDLIKLKTSDTVYIIGTSSSINSLTQLQWNTISKQDSIGLNFSFLTDHIPTIQLIQFPYDSSDLSKMILGLDEKMKLSEMTIIIRTVLDVCFSNSEAYKFNNSIGRFFIPRSEVYIPWRDKKQFKLLLKIMMKTIKPEMIYTRGGAVTSAIFLAYSMGYKKISLVGINDGSSKYFYHMPEYKNDRFEKFVPSFKIVGQSHPHFNIEKSDSYMTTIEVLDLIESELFLPNNVVLEKKNEFIDDLFYK
jgi:hypothetical protein